MDWGEIILTLVLDLILTVFVYLLVPVIFCIRKKPMTQKQIKTVVIINGICVCLLCGIIAGKVTGAVFLWSWVAKKIMEKRLLVDDKNDEFDSVEQNEKTPSTVEQPESENLCCVQTDDLQTTTDSLKLENKIAEPPLHPKSKKTWFVPAIISIAITVIIGIIAVILGIPAIKYNEACSKLENGFFEEAIELFEDLEGYKKSEEKIREAKYGYVIAHKNNDDITTYSYLKELKKIDYRNSENIFKSLYEWKISVIAINSSKYDETTNNTFLSKYNPVYFHMILSGGEPDDSARITVKSTLPNGNMNEYVFEDRWEDGDYLWYGWHDGIYPNPEFGISGTLRCDFYDEDGNWLGAGSVYIINLDLDL